MKKFVFVILFTLMLCSCQAPYKTAADVMSRLDISNGIIYKNDKDICEAEYISPEELGYLYYGESTPLAELDYMESYCIYLSQGKSISELHIFEAKYQSDVEALKRMLKSRSDFLSAPGINPNSSDFFCDTEAECEILSRGRFVFLVVGDTKERTKSIDRLF